MLASTLLHRACTVTTRTDSGSTDDYGNPTDAETSLTTVCDLQQQQRTEPGAQGELSDTRWLLILPPGTEITTRSTVTVDDIVYEVIGDPWTAHLHGRPTHVEATLRRTGA